MSAPCAKEGTLFQAAHVHAREARAGCPAAGDEKRREALPEHAAVRPACVNRPALRAETGQSLDAARAKLGQS